MLRDALGSCPALLWGPAAWQPKPDDAGESRRGRTPVRSTSLSPEVKTAAVERRRACVSSRCSPTMRLTHAPRAARCRHVWLRAVQNFEGASCGAPLPRILSGEE